MTIRAEVTGLAAAVLGGALGGCSTPPASSVAGQVIKPAIPVHEPAPRQPLSAEACLLGQSCLELDPRPFEPCLVTTSRCERDGEFVYVRPDHGSS